jgi:hypothetical protein
MLRFGEGEVVLKGGRRLEARHDRSREHPAGRHIARIVHAADHAAQAVILAARQDLTGAVRRDLRQDQRRGPTVRGVARRIGASVLRVGLGRRRRRLSAHAREPPALIGSRASEEALAGEHGEGGVVQRFVQKMDELRRVLAVDGPAEGVLELGVNEVSVLFGLLKALRRRLGLQLLDRRLRRSLRRKRRQEPTDSRT